MDDSIAYERLITTAPSSSGDASNINVIGHSNVDIINRGDHNRTHVGPDSRYNRGVVVNAASANLTVHGESSEILDKLRRAPAYYDSSLRKQAQQCMQDTRVTILYTIYEWVDSLDNPPMFWLHGPAGTGKSTIAHTVAEECRRRGRLGASFFFAHANAECSDPNLFFSTIAYQLSKFVPDLQQHIVDGVRGHPSPQDASIPTQLEEFILAPMRKLSNIPAREPIIVVVDAFDECSDPRKASEILQLLSAKIPSFPLRLKFFVTSRPEPEIRSILHPDIHRISRSFDLLRDIDASSTDEDMKRFLRFELGKTGKEYELPSWPREIDVESLAQQAGGLFIFAHTSIELIRDKDVMDPESQLAMLRNIASNGPPAFNLNALYSRILWKAMPERASTAVQGRVVTIIHAIVGLRAPLALCAIERLLGLDCGAIRSALNQLRSIFIVPDNDKETVQVIHPSFARYIADEESCTEKIFVVGGRKLHSQLAKYCLKQMKIYLKQNICDFKDFMTVEAPITDEKSLDLDSRTLSEELKYSCENFAAHVFFADRQDGELCDMVAEWANQYLPYWLEVLALTGSFHNALPSLRLLNKFNNDISSASHAELPGTDRGEPSEYDYAVPTQADYTDSTVHTSKTGQSKCPQSFLRLLPKWLKAVTVAPNQGPQLTDSSQLLADAIRMVSEFYDEIKRFPYQIYASCLGFCPLDSPLFKQYSQLSTVRVLSGERNNWTPLLHGFKDPDGKVDGLTFSPDGRILASRSSVGKIRLWDLETRESRILACHNSRRDTAFMFSPDSKYIAADGSVYRVTTGEEVLVPGICSAFSPGGLYIALGCVDDIIRLYDMQAPKLSLLGELSGHGGTITALAFSSDNKFLTSACSDATICVWNCSSQEMMKQFRCRESSGHVTFSANGTYVATHYESFVPGSGFEEYVWIADIQTGNEKSIKVLANPNIYYGGSMTTTTIFSPSGSIMAFCNNGALYVVRWVAATQLTSTRLSREFGSAITSISFTPDEQSLLIGNQKGLIRSWRIPKYGGSAHSFDFECKAHFGAVKAITFPPNGNYFASASNDGSICVWDSTSVDLHEPDVTHTSDIHAQIRFAPDGQTVAVNSGNTLSKIDASTGHSIVHKKDAGLYSVHSMIISADNKYLACNNIKELLFWDTGSISCNWGRYIEAHAFSPDATYYAMLFSAGHLWVHDLRNGESRKVVPTNRKATFWRMRFSPDSRHIVSCGGDICVFDAEKGVQMDLNLPVRKNVSDCAFSPCGQHIALAHENGLDVLEYLAKEPNVKEVRRQVGYWFVEFSTDGKYMLLAGATEIRGESKELHLDLFRADTLEILYTTNISREHISYAMREFSRTGRLLNHPLFQPSEHKDFPYLLDKDGWVITASSRRLCQLPVANRGTMHDVNGNRMVVISPEGKVTLIQFGPNPVCILTPP